jgi:hypothetical protein
VLSSTISSFLLVFCPADGKLGLRNSRLHMRITLKTAWDRMLLIAFQMTPVYQVHLLKGPIKEYIKEDGIWKIYTLAFQMLYAFQPSKQKTTPEISSEAPSDDAMDPENIKLSPDDWAEYDTQYPSGYIYPFHFKHPVTGRPTSENVYNAKLKLNPNPFRPEKIK